MTVKTRMMLKNIKIFDTDAEQFTENRDIFIEDGCITAIGQMDSTDYADTQIHDCDGKYAVPGLWECHAHLVSFTVENPETRKNVLKEFGKPEDDSWEEFVQDQCRRYLDLGILYVRDVGGPVAGLKNLTQKIHRGQYHGPDIFYAGPMLEKSPPAWLDEENFPGFTIGIDTMADADAIIQTLCENDARLMKTFNKFDSDVYKYLVEQAAEHHLPVTHDPGKPLFNHMPMDRAMDLGIRCFEHAKAPLPVVLKPEFKTAHDQLIYTPDDNNDKKALLSKIFNAGTDAIDRNRLDTFIDDMISRDVYFCFTLHIMESMKQIVASEPKDEKEAQRIAMYKNFIEISLLLARVMIQHGVKILVGHDGCQAENTIREMELLQECGLREAAIIKGATIYPAQWLGIDHQTGTISETKSADIVVLDKNPLENISNIRSVAAVIHKGRWIYGLSI